ncbi:MAG: polyprenyl synthetase family protein [Sedimentisphaerales bacterium]|nr:polyprenyl synthetase family protein [Sedimentisphaerales bacterium]
MNRIKADKQDFKLSLTKKADTVNRAIEDYLAEQQDIEPQIKKAISYVLNAPGKRIRAAMVLWCCQLCDGNINNDAVNTAIAVEMIHTYSLVHDDLPAMDDDDLRRGQQSCHKAFGESTAILTGDALLTMAFELLASRISDDSIAIRLIKTLSQAAGPAGMIAGQMADIAGQQTQGSLDELRYIHKNKTAKMFAAAAALGAICGKATENKIESLYKYGLNIGLGFQVADDILDISATSRQLGKTAGKDSKQGKTTYPSVIGMQQSKKTASQLADRAIEELKDFDSNADLLRHLALELVKRTN